jgi:hypothetical protein
MDPKIEKNIFILFLLNRVKKLLRITEKYTQIQTFHQNLISKMNAWIIVWKNFIETSNWNDPISYFCEIDSVISIPETFRLTNGTEVAAIENSLISIQNIEQNGMY